MGVDATIIDQASPDIVILHNTPQHRCDKFLLIPTLQYLHSRIQPSVADGVVFCSHWLDSLTPNIDGEVCYQAVPRPKRPRGNSESRDLSHFPTIGRICTPTRAKWPELLPEFYRGAANRFPKVQWEFVGCPGEMQKELTTAWNGRTRFFPASWDAREQLWRWDALLYHNPRVPESFGRTVAEAMRAGCIPIVDNQGGFVEQIAEGCGFLCDDESEFHSAIGGIQSLKIDESSHNPASLMPISHFHSAAFERGY